MIRASTVITIRRNTASDLCTIEFRWLQLIMLTFLIVFQLLNVIATCIITDVLLRATTRDRTISVRAHVAIAVVGSIACVLQMLVLMTLTGRS